MQDQILPKPIHVIQAEIIEAFHSLAGDRESILTYIMELGEQLTPMKAQDKTEHNVIKGCLSTVWLIYKKQVDRLFFQGDSNTAITKGLLSLLLRVLSGQKTEDIIHANLYFVSEIGITQLIGSQRSGGFASMVKAMKLIAIKQKAARSMSRLTDVV